MRYDVVIVGGGPGGLSAALALGRARKRVLLCDAGQRRNAAAERIHNFVTQDGTPPEEFRRIGREQLATYPNVEVRNVWVDSISGTSGEFLVSLKSGAVELARWEFAVTVSVPPRSSANLLSLKYRGGSRASARS